MDQLDILSTVYKGKGSFGPALCCKIKLQEVMMDRLIFKLEELRKSRRYSNERVSLSLGKSYESYYRDRVSGRVKFTAEDILKLIELYELDDDQILDLIKSCRL